MAVPTRQGDIKVVGHLELLLARLNIPPVQWGRVRLRLERLRRLPDASPKGRPESFGAFLTWRAESVRLGHTDSAVVLNREAAEAVREAARAYGIYVVDNTALPRRS